MASRKSDGSDAWRGAAAQPNGASALAYGAPAYAAQATYGAPAYAQQVPQPPAAEPPWMVLVGGTEQRPMPAAALRAAVQSGAVALETLVWRAGMSAWAPIGSIGELVQFAPAAAAMPPAAAPAASAWDAPLAQGPTAAQQAAEQYLSTRGPGLGDTTTYAAWDPPQGRVPLRRSPPPPTNITSELLATGMVVFGIVMFTLYAISLGGAFTAGGAHAHGAAAAQAAK